MISWFASPVYAQEATQLCMIDDMIVDAVNWIWPFAGLAVFLMFLSGGAMWMTSAGDPQKRSKAMSTFLWAFVGAAILALMMLIFGVFESILGLPEGTLGKWTIDC